MRLGILGGTFNPIHIGHVRLGIEALEQMKLDEVHFVPSYHPPHKKNLKVLPFDIRCEFVEKAISSISQFRLSRVEEKREGPSYTIFTLQRYKKLYPDAELFFILGLKDFLLISTWYKWMNLLKMCHFIVAGEKKEILKIHDFLQEKVPETVVKNRHWQVNNTQIYPLIIPELKISSSLIRKKIKNNCSITYLVPPSIEKEILKHKENF